MFGDDPPVLTDHDAVRIGMNFDGMPTARAATEYLLLSNRTRQVFSNTDAGTEWKPSNRPV